VVTPPGQSVLDSCNEGDYFTLSGSVAYDGDEHVEIEEPDLVFEHDENVDPPED
jgi:hypothetical protein